MERKGSCKLCDLAGGERAVCGNREIQYCQMWDESPLFSRSVVSDSLRPHGLQHTRLPCPLPTPTAYSNSCPLSLWCHPTIASSVVPFCSHLQSFPASRSFQMTQFFASGGSKYWSFSFTSVLPMNIQDWFPLGFTGLLSLQSKGLWRVFSKTTVKSINSSALRFLYGPILISIHDYWKTIALSRWTFIGK